MKKKKIEQQQIPTRLIKINSFLIAVIISANIIAMAINMLIGLNNSIILPFIVSALISLVINKKVNLIIIVPLSLFILSFFGISYIQIGASIHLKEYLLSFFTFGITSFIIASQPFEVKKVMNYITLIYVLTSWVFINLDIDNMLPGNKMGLGYLILPIILVCIHQIFYVKFSLSKKIFYLVILSWYGYFMIEVGTRGGFLSIALYILLLFVFGKKLNPSRLMICLLGLGLFTFIYSNFLSLLLSTKNILEDLNLNSYFINKSITLIRENNILNGRNTLYELAFEGFKENWFYGNGIGFFHDFFGIYVHNLFLQILNEGGILLLTPFVLIMFYGLFLMFFSKKIDRSFKLFICFIFSLVIPRLMVSSIFWKEQIFWILIIIMISFKCFKNYRFSNN
ncbi:O-antigen ligase family protein [Priestia filamentosa]|uniref:O-antigen ligase family protein n=1 Tax=Priestia filamentosa TaxID=1402861 RepID=UPI0028947E8C|nr:hypothetical protein [Priestia filamentosa]MDT3766198.1 hypothetical protein [Priestia filamentosa]